jgi:hypothetical protein
MIFFSFERDKILEKLVLPEHMIVYQYNDMFLYCTACAEGKFITSYNNEFYEKTHQDLAKDNVKYDSPIYDAALEEIANHYLNLLNPFITYHSKCIASEENRQWNLHCL